LKGGGKEKENFSRIETRKEKERRKERRDLEKCGGDNSHLERQTNNARKGKGEKGAMAGLLDRGARQKQVNEGKKSREVE